jgi:hypothetical protein
MRAKARCTTACNTWWRAAAHNSMPGRSNARRAERAVTQAPSSLLRGEEGGARRPAQGRLLPAGQSRAARLRPLHHRAESRMGTTTYSYRPTLVQFIRPAVSTQTGTLAGGGKATRAGGKAESCLLGDRWGSSSTACAGCWCGVRWRQHTRPARKARDALRSHASSGLSVQVAHPCRWPIHPCAVFGKLAHVMGQVEKMMASSMVQTLAAAAAARAHHAASAGRKQGMRPTAACS